MQWQESLYNVTDRLMFGSLKYFYILSSGEIRYYNYLFKLQHSLALFLLYFLLVPIVLLIVTSRDFSLTPIISIILTKRRGARMKTKKMKMMIKMKTYLVFSLV